ncbi:NAD-dependent succinate-semialdehyde dehydrogenase [Flavisolibacter ginsenosidimutans]|uniref:NAD-dependent succinate-semialdehyde dehydrogenase n=1 Tax=Flavisolibacter ginsenosidimutans TaxID=661481 RepID=A0A5B8UD52_9BACT|nr:NAD-dependent succinate-semialdehyde dehydrogenase [Flavisolibacter ginsenosidimutans]QEC54403.1 NAD-dependent succinate-semialdehyde dehydrogenase [Flavisolibacter ginsenosidimutans]
MSIQSINPINGETVKTYKEDSTEQIRQKIEAAQVAWQDWRRTSFEERRTLLAKAGTVLRERKNELAELMAIEMGKPLKDGVSEIDKCASVCDYYAANGEGFLKDEEIKTEASNSFVSFQPLGVVLAIMPWNFPFWQTFRFLAPGLTAGNCGLLKHASNVPGCALVIEEILLQAGFPKGVFQTLMIGSKAVKEVIAHPHIKAVTLTGSTNAGIQVAQQAASLLKKTVLELGGSDPYIILEDADLEAAAETCALSRLINNGQSCIAAKRFIVVKSVEEKFTALFKERMAARITGDPFDAKTDLGPMARIDLRDELHKQVLENVKAGAKLILGGTLPADSENDAFYTPTILTGMKKGMPAYTEEIFGPVASIISANDVAEAVQIANDTPFGLGAAVFTADISLGEKIAREELQAGSCFVNTNVRSDPRLPFGGINQSGYGRELGLFGIHEFVNVKTVLVK